MSPIHRFLGCTLVWMVAALAPATVQAQTAVPAFSKEFSPNEIGPGSASTLIFTIDNRELGIPHTDLAFTDVLPAGLTIADGTIGTTCVEATLTAPAGGSTITFSGGEIEVGAVCTVSVDVTASTAATYSNTSGDLTSSAGNSGPASDDLTVSVAVPGFTKGFSPSTVSLGGTSTLTFTIDNTANAARIGNLDFTDVLPTGMVVASPANASTDCVATSAPNTLLTASPGAGTISLDANGFAGFAGFETLSAGSTCTVSVDVTSAVVGTHVNTVSLLADANDVGKATASLTVTGAAPGTLQITKDFTDDPVAPGGSTTLEFTITNLDRSNGATDVAFDDVLTDMFAGLAASSATPASDPCGAGSALSLGGTVSLTGGAIPAGGTCTFSVTVDVPTGATAGTYTNATSAVTGTIDGTPVTGNTASNNLTVLAAAPLTFTKQFVPGSVLAGDDVIVRYTIANPNTGAGTDATDITFTDEVTDPSGAVPVPTYDTGFLPFPVSAVVPAGGTACGGSVALVSLNADRQGLRLTGGTLAPGADCTFDVTLTIPASLPGAIYSDSSDVLTATVLSTTLTSPATADSLTVSGGVNLSFTKAFSGAVAPGGTVDMTFEIENAPGSGPVTGLGFTDDLSPVLAGLTAGTATTNTCGGSMALSAGDTLLTYSGGALADGASCAITVPLSAPAAAASGTYTNTTSDLSATGGGLGLSFPGASAELTVSGLEFSKAFLTNPVVAGDTTTLRYTIENVHPTDAATISFFTDNLGDALTGLAATGPATSDSCGGTLSGTALLSYLGGSIPSGQSCTIEVPVLVPAAAADGDYNSATSILFADQGGPVSVAPATTTLTVQGTQLQLTKSFTGDPVAPGGTATLDFTLTNLNASASATGIAFTDDLDAMLSGATMASPDGIACGGTVSGTGTGQVGFSGGSLAAAATCTFQVQVSVPGSASAGVFTNVTSDLSGTMSGFPVSGDPARDTLQVTTVGTRFSKSFSGPVAAGDTATLTFTITNPNTGTVSGLAFTDDLDAMLPGAVATSLPAQPCGAGSSVGGTSLLTFSGGELAGGGATCAFDVEVSVPVSASAGLYPNTTSNLTSSGLLSATPATASLQVEPAPGFAKVFAPDALGLGQISTLTFTVDNTAAVLDATGLDFTDILPAGMQVAAPSNASTTCSGGTLTATPGSGTISYTGGTAPASTSCAVSVDVVATATGDLVNTTGGLTSRLGASGSATDTLTVVPQPLFSKNFAPNPISLGASATLTFTIDNRGSGLAATALDFTDDLPANMVLATPAGGVTDCTGGTLTATAGTGTVSYAGGTVAAGAVCTLAVDVTTTTFGDFANTSGDLTSSQGNSGGASDTLTVLSPELDIVVPPLGPVAAGGNLVLGDQPAGTTQTLTLTLENNGNSDLGLTSLFAGNEANATIAVSTPPPRVIPAGTSGTMAVDYTPTGTGPFGFEVTITSNDPDESPYTINVSGTGIDATAPSGYSVAFDQDPVSAANQSAASFTFAGAEVGTDYAFTITSDGGGAPVSGGGTIATATDSVTGLDLSGLADGTLTLTFALTDAAGNTGPDATDTTTKDATTPTATLTGPLTAQSGAFTVDVTFSETVFGMDLARVDIDNGSASALTGSGAAYGFTVTPDHDGPIRIRLLAGAASDASGNPSAEAGPLLVIAHLTGVPNPNPLPDADGDGIPDNLESAFNDRDGDGIPDIGDFDPQGYFYCEDDGQIIPGGGFSVSGPLGSNSGLGIANGINITRDGSTGEIQWFALVPGTFTMSLTYPAGAGVPSTARLSSGNLDMTTLLPDNPAFLGSSEAGSIGVLADASLAANPVFYTSFTIEPGDPFVLSNNIPMTLCAENAVNVTAATDGAEANGGTPTEVTFTVTQARQSAQDTVIAFVLGGGAVDGSDIVAPAGTVTIPAGATSATLTVPVLEDGEIEGPETVTLTLTGIASGDLTTLLGTTPTASATILDDDFADIAVTNDDLTASEGGGDNARMTFALMGAPGAPVTLSFAGDSQCSVSPATMTFTAADYGAAQALTIRARNDDVVEGPHSCQPTVTVASADARFDALPLVLATVTVTDDLVDQIRAPLTQILEEDLRDTVETQQRGFSRIAKGALQRLQDGAELPCGTLSAFDVDGNLEIKDATGSATGTFGSDAYNCATNTREITDGSFSLNKTEDTGLQALLQVAFQREKLVSDSAIAGYFVGAYVSRTDVSDLGEGEIDGFGLNGGVYGARGVSDGLFLDYYLAGAVGRHRFDIDFDAAPAKINAQGDYRYLAGFAGVGLSGQHAFDAFVMKPRVAIDLAYARAGEADVTASQLGLTNDGVIDLDDFSGMRATAEITFESLAAPGGSESLAAQMRTAITPRLTCSLNSYDSETECGVGLALAWEHTNAASGLSFGIEIDAERIDEDRSLTFNVTRERPIWNGSGAVVTRLSMPQAQTWQVEHGVQVDF